MSHSPPPSDRPQTLWTKVLAFSERFGNLLSRTLLTVLYFVLLGPFALVYQLVADPLHIRRRRAGNWTTWTSSNDSLASARKQD